MYIVYDDKTNNELKIKEVENIAEAHYCKLGPIWANEKGEPYIAKDLEEAGILLKNFRLWKALRREIDQVLEKSIDQDNKTIAWGE